VLRGLAATAAAALAATAAAAHGGAAPRCRPGDLRLTPTFYGEAVQQFVQTLTFRNTGAACTLAGWPAVRLRVGGRWSAPARRVVQGDPKARPFAPVTLRPGARASFDVYGADWDALTDRACPRSTAASVAAPGAAAALVVRLAVPACGSLFVAPVIAGASDHRAWSVVWHP
jgi:hypothetical protein